MRDSKTVADQNSISMRLGLVLKVESIIRYTHGRQKIRTRLALLIASRGMNCNQLVLESPSHGFDDRWDATARIV